MKDEMSHLNFDERIRAENNILKMKLMLEKAALFHASPEPLPPEIEHEFLKHVIAFEEQLEQQKMVRVFEKIGSPQQFAAVETIPEEQTEAAWVELDKYMRNHGVSLEVCSPNVSSRELYRFAVEELFSMEIADLDIPGVICCFIYDEFHPDPVYDNGRAAISTIASVMRQSLAEYLPHLRKIDLRLNDKMFQTDDEFKRCINHFKAAYESIDEPELEQSACSVDGKYSVVSGSYRLRVSLQTEHIQLQGQWSVEFEFDQELGYWYAFNVQIEGVNF